jgi:hypothetical protein
MVHETGLPKQSMEVAIDVIWHTLLSSSAALYPYSALALPLNVMIWRIEILLRIRSWVTIPYSSIYLTLFETPGSISGRYGIPGYASMTAVVNRCCDPQQINGVLVYG